MIQKGKILKNLPVSISIQGLKSESDHAVYQRNEIVMVNPVVGCRRVDK